MKKLSSFVLSVLSILAVFTLFASSSSANEKTFVDISKYNVSNISGNATKGARVSVLLNNKKEVGSTYASKSNGSYKVTLKNLNKGSKLYVYAQTKNSLQKPYIIITLQSNKTVSVKNNTPKVTKQTNHSKKANSNSTSKLVIKNISGKWQSRLANDNSYEILNFDTKDGFQRDVYKNGKLKNNLVKYAAYSYKHISSDVFEFSYKAKNAKPLYMKFTSNNKFTLSNDKNNFNKNVLYFSRTK